MDDYYKPHEFALILLKKLALSKGLKFNELLIKELESEHMNYHLKKLISVGYVLKNGNEYVLTDKGKNYVGLLDDNIEVIEKQPKVSILLNIRRKNKKNEIEHLLCKRLRQPYLGKIGRLTGKLKFGETILEAAIRELYEETGLEVTEKDCVLNQVYHKLRWNEEGEAVQDNIFFRISISNTKGNLIIKTPVQENFWITKKELEQNKNLDLFDSLVLDDKDNPKDLWFKESKDKASGY